MTTWTALGTRQLVRFYDPYNPTTTFTPQLNPRQQMVKPNNIRKYTETTNGTSVILGDREYPPKEIQLVWPIMDSADYESFRTMCAINPLVFVDNNDNGYMGLLQIDDVQQVPDKTYKVYEVHASFLVISPYNGTNSVLNVLTNPTLTTSAAWTASNGYIPSGVPIYFYPTVCTPWGETTAGTEYSICNGIQTPIVAPTCGSSAGGALGATTYYVRYTFTTANGETQASPETTKAVAANNVLTVTSPTSPNSSWTQISSIATGWNVYVSTASGNETKQASNIAIGTNWTEPTSGLIAGTALPTSNTSGIANPSFQLQWGAPASNWYRKTRIYWAPTSGAATATLMTEVLSGLTNTFTVYTSYVQYSFLIPGSVNTAFTGYWAGGKFVQTN